MSEWQPAPASLGRLNGRVALVTGGGSGMGRASAIALAREGASVVVADLNEVGARGTVDAIAGMAIAIHLDVTDPDACERAVAFTEEHFGALHILHNSAGVTWAGRDGISEHIDPQVWDQVIAVNLSGTFYMCHFAIKAMRRAGSGSIINMASSMAMLPTGLLDAYAASKGGVATLSRSMAHGVGRRNIRVNALCPGYVDTPVNAEAFTSAELHDSLALGHATGTQSVEEIADLVVFLASDDSRSLTGAVLTCDRGWTSFKAPEMYLHPGL